MNVAKDPNHIRPVTAYDDTVSLSLLQMSAFIFTGIACIILSALIWRERTFELSLTLVHNSIYTHGYTTLFQMITQYGMSLILLIYVVFFLHTYQTDRYAHNTSVYVCAILLFIIAGLSVDIIKTMIDKARPSEILPGLTALTQSPHTASYPSAHTTKAIALVLPFLFLTHKRSCAYLITTTLSLCIALLIAYSRIALQKHFLSDVIAGIGCAIICVPLAVYATRRIMKKHHSRFTPRTLVVFYIVCGILLAFISF